MAHDLDYVGSGGWLPGYPTGPVTVDDDADAARLLATGLYREREVSPSEEAPTLPAVAVLLGPPTESAEAEERLAAPAIQMTADTPPAEG